MKPQLSVFISYARHDSVFSKVLIEGIRRHTKNSRNFIWEIWDDSKIGIGTIWDKEIQENVQKADVAILLVSSAFLGSDYIREKELNVFLNNAATSHKVLIAPVLLLPCFIPDQEKLSLFQFYLPKAEDFGLSTSGYSNFSYSDLVRFNQSDGSLIPNAQMERYHLEFYLRLEKTAEKHFSKKIIIDKSKGDEVELTENFNKERNHYLQIINNLEQKIIQLTLRMGRMDNIEENIQQEREDLYNLIAKAKIKEAITRFMKILNDSDNVQGKNAIILLSARFNELERNNVINIISTDTYTIERNKISNALLDLIGTL